MRFLHSVHTVDPVSGGPIEFIRQLIPLHERAGHTMEIACMDDPAKTFVKDFPATVHCFPALLAGYGYSTKYVRWLRQHCQNYDAVIVHGLWQYPAIGSWLALRHTDTPYFVFPHGMLDPWFNQAYLAKRLKKSIYWAIAEHRVVRDAQAVLFASAEECRLARESFAPYICHEMIVGIGIAAPPGDPYQQKAAFLSAYPELRNKQIVLFLGRIHEKKGCDLLMPAFSKLVPTYPNLHLVLAGPDNSDYAAKLKSAFLAAGLADHVTWTGLVFKDTKWGALHTAGALILPSHQENFAIVVAEALACGKPALVSNKVNIWKDILDEGAGLVEADDLAGTEKLLVRWLNLTESQEKTMQANAKRCFEQKFQIDRAYETLISVLQGATIKKGAELR